MKRIVIQKKKKNPGAYSPELRSFALTLKFYSNKAYNFVRKSFDLGLPHASVIRSWYSTIDGEPGFTKATYLAMSAKVAASKKSGQDVLCSLMLDEMAIRKHIEWDGKRFRGFVDFGTGLANDSDSMPAATEALVLMAVSINSNWKVPCGYFLIDGLSGKEKANLVTTCLEKLHDVGVKVVSLTCDGPSANFSMLKALGANLSPDALTPYFKHPSNPLIKVYVFLDVCHMLKLVRNTFADYNILHDTDGNPIKWQYIQDLHNLQESQGLHLANKLKSAHINWRQQKMKVNLAAQSLSSSVADALDYCDGHLQLPQFRNCQPTSTFLRIFDHLFDILNSRNPLAKNYKAPLRVSNYQCVEKFLDEAIEYIKKIKDASGKPIITSPRKTGFIGFLVAIKSIQALYKELVAVTPSKLKYLLTYKFSQDHIELFFAAVRSAGGWNNNPTTSQFISSYRQLLMRHMIEGGHGNCTPQDNTKILDNIEDQCDVNLLPTGTSDISIARRYDLELRQPVTIDHDYCDVSNSIELSEYKEAAISYIAGFAGKMAKKRICCPECISALSVPKNAADMSFVVWKSNGGLTIPSPSLLKICQETEKCVMRMLKTSSGHLPQCSGLLGAISTSVLTACVGTDVFNSLDEHMFDSTATNNHVASLIKCCSQCYTKIRMHHLGKRLTEKLQGKKVRKQFTKLILFNNQ